MRHGWNVVLDAAIPRERRIPTAVHRLGERLVDGDEEDGKDGDKSEDNPCTPAKGKHSSEDTTRLVDPAPGEVAPRALWNVSIVYHDSIDGFNEDGKKGRDVRMRHRRPRPTSPKARITP